MLPNKAVVLLGILLLSGCTHQALMESDLSSQLSSARSATDYVKALDIINKAPSDHPQYESLQQQRESLMLEIARYQQQRVAEADKLASSGRWQEAFTLINELDRQWRGNETITAAQGALETRQNLRLQQLRADLLTAEAEWLLAQKNNVSQLSSLADSQAESLVRTVRRRQSDVADQMSPLGQFFADQKDWRRTRALLEGARKLRDSEEREPLLMEAEKQLASAAHRREQASSQRTRQRADTLIEAYRKSGSISDLVAARDYLQKNNQDGTLDEVATSLESLCREQFRQGLRRGDNLYAAGNYPQAEKAWLEVSPLYPGDNELAAKIERVRRVLGNLQNLKR